MVAAHIKWHMPKSLVERPRVPGTQLARKITSWGGALQGFFGLSAIQVGPEGDLIMQDASKEIIGGRGDGGVAEKGMGAELPEYTLSDSGDVQQVVHQTNAHRVAFSLHKSVGASTNSTNGTEMQTFDSSHMRGALLADFEKLEKVILDSGWNNETADGNIFEDGHGITMGLYDQFVVSGTTVCETGFGGGHGALYSILICHDCHIYVFDDGGRPYAKPVAQYLETKYPGRLTVTWGDSNQTLPKFQEKYPGVTCDFVMIDGGRSYDMAKADTVNFAKVVTSGSTPVLQHDCPVPGWNDTINGVCRGWHELNSTGCVQIQEEFPTVSVGHLNVSNCTS